MRFALRKLVVASLAAVLTVGCGTIRPVGLDALVVEHSGSVRPTGRCSPAHPLRCTPAQRRAMHAWFLHVALTRWLHGLTVIPPDLLAVANCVKAHESGNYAEASHPSAGSGAYQYVPSTWQHWSALAGYGGYTYAYLAPPIVQDRVFVYTLRNGGAGNWSNAFGYDPCTTGM